MTDTQPARAKKQTARALVARRSSGWVQPVRSSRASRHASTRAPDTSTHESSPNATRPSDPAATPAASATTASTTFQPIVTRLSSRARRSASGRSRRARAPAYRRSSRHLVRARCRRRGDPAPGAGAGRPGRAARAPAGRRRAGSAPAGPRPRRRPGRSRAGRPDGWRPPGGSRRGGRRGRPGTPVRPPAGAGSAGGCRRRAPGPTRSRTARVSAYDGEPAHPPTVHRWLNSHQAEQRDPAGRSRGPGRPLG